MTPVFWGMVRTPEAERDMDAIGRAAAALQSVWGILDAHLDGRDFVADDVKASLEYAQDPETGANIRTLARAVESVEVVPGVVLDFNEAQEVVGVEMLRLSMRSDDLNLTALQFESV